MAPRETMRLVIAGLGIFVGRCSSEIERVVLEIRVKRKGNFYLNSSVDV